MALTFSTGVTPLPRVGHSAKAPIPARLRMVPDAVAEAGTVMTYAQALARQLPDQQIENCAVVVVGHTPGGHEVFGFATPHAAGLGDQLPYRSTERGLG